MKRFLTLLLTLALALPMSACAVGAEAAAEPTGEALAGFSDVAADAWYAGAVEWCVGRGLMDGVSAGSFAPEAPATRLTLVTALYRHQGSPAAGKDPGFLDIRAGDPGYEAVAWAAEEGVVNGYDDNRFGGGDPVTREQFAAILWRRAGSPAAPAAAPFADQEQISPYAVSAVAWAEEAGIVNGKGEGRFDPRSQITRGEAAAMLQRWITEEAPREERRIVLTVGETRFSAALADTEAARALWELLPLTLSMNELNGNEKFADLPQSLPTDAQRPGTIRTGDLMLYGTDCLVLFYETFSSSYSYTPLGRLEDSKGLATALGTGEVTLTVSREDPEPPAAGGKILVAYFSATNNTAGVAEQIASVTGGDLFEICPAVPYTADDLNYNSDCRANREQDDPAARPAMAEDHGVENWADYDVIFLGYPIWWGKAPKILYTFLEGYDFTGKTVVPFCTSGSSGIGSSADDLQAAAPAALWLKGRRFSGGASRQEVERWVQSLDLSGQA